MPRSARTGRADERWSGQDITGIFPAGAVRHRGIALWHQQRLRPHRRPVGDVGWLRAADRGRRRCAPLVGYEHGRDLASAFGAGFEKVGSLTAWLLDSRE
jgi:hypothetical protein